MRTFYIFKINKIFRTIYDNKDYNLFLFFNNIENSKSLTIEDRYKIYSKLIKKINKNRYNNLIFYKHNKDVYYNKRKNIHCISNKYEKSKIYINDTFIKITTNRNFCTFLNDLGSLKDDLFVIDFENKDYFWLKSLITK